jgi:hypothetical protein
MERLVELIFSDVSKYIADANQFPDVILLAAGLVPNLKKLLSWSKIQRTTMNL